MKIEFNRKNILKAMALGSAFFLAIYGLAQFAGHENNNNDKARLIPLDNKPKVHELYYNGVYYQTPNSTYSLEVINDTVYAVREFELEHELEEFTREDGSTTYVKSPEDVEVDGKGYRHIKEIKAPIVIKKLEVNEQKNYSL